MGRERCTSMGQSQGVHRADDGRLDDAFGLPDGRALPASSSALQHAAVQHATMQHATMQQSSRRPQRNQFRQHGGMCARAEAAARAGGAGSRGYWWYCWPCCISCAFSLQRTGVNRQSFAFFHSSESAKTERTERTAPTLKGSTTKAKAT